MPICIGNLDQISFYTLMVVTAPIMWPLRGDGPIHSLRVVAVGRERLFEGRVKYVAARMRLVFVDKFVPPVDAFEERFPLVTGERGCDLHAEHHSEALAVASGDFLAGIQDQESVDIGGVFHEKLQIPLARADEFGIPAEIRDGYIKPPLGLPENLEELVQFRLEDLLLHGLLQGLLEEPRPERKQLLVIQIVFPCFDLEPPERLRGAFEQRPVHGGPVSEERRIGPEVGDVNLFFGCVELRGERPAEMGTLIGIQDMIAQNRHVPVGVFVGPVRGAGAVENR